MQVLEKHDNILRDEYDLDMISGKLVSDDTIERGHRADSVRGNKGIWTPLDNTLMPKAIVISLNKNLKSISDKIIHSNGRDLIHVLCDTRDYIHLYFNHTKQNPVRIAEYTRGSSDKAVLQKLMNDCALTLDYCNDPLALKAIHTVTATSLALREVIAYTVGFDQVAHFPSQVKDKTGKFSKKAFLLDSHYMWRENMGIVDLRKK